MLDALYLVSRENCEFQLSAILEDLEPAAWPVDLGDREQRSTGALFTLYHSQLPPTHSPSVHDTYQSYIGIQ